MRRLVTVLCLVMFALAASAQGATVMAEGTGYVVVPADTVTIAVGVLSTEENATLAAAEVGSKLNDTVDALLAAGVPEDGIVPGYSGGFMSGQSYSRVCTVVNNSTVCREEEYNATNLAARTVMIRMDAEDDALVKTVLETAEAEGAQAKITGYSLEDSGPAMSQARQKATENARENARDYAVALGLRLGKVLEVSDFALDPFGQLFDPLFGDSFFEDPFAGPEVEEGMVEVRARVMVTFEAN